jgi:heme/copper-type cytochrome/quinol oxidase subunit 4
MKFLKLLCGIFGFIFAVCLVTVPFLFDAETIKDWRIAASLILLFFILVLMCFFGYGVITDHERNMYWKEFLGTKNAQKSCNSVRRIRKFPNKS